VGRHTSDKEKRKKKKEKEGLVRKGEVDDMVGIHTCSTIKKKLPSSPSLMMDSP
jgi:hypothetical protein